MDLQLTHVNVPSSAHDALRVVRAELEQTA